MHLKPVGSGYEATSWENFVVAEVAVRRDAAHAAQRHRHVVARDGTFYYVIGNRAHAVVPDEGDVRRQAVDGARGVPNTDGAAVADGAPVARGLSLDPQQSEGGGRQLAALGSEDRFLRFAARVALETVSADAWRARAVSETDPATSMIALLALARVGGAPASEELFGALERFPLTTLSDRLKIQKLRVIEVAVSRNGKPSAQRIAQLVADVDAVFPGSSFALNTEMSQILSAFNAPTAVPKTMRLASLSPIYQENFAYRYNLRAVTSGWTPESGGSPSSGSTSTMRRPFAYNYREWFNRVNQQPRLAGNAGPLNLIRQAALETLTDVEKADADLTAILGEYRAPAAGGRGRGQGANPFGAPGGAPAGPAPAGRGGVPIN